MKKKIFGVTIAVVAVTVIIVLWTFYPRMGSHYNKERDLPILYRDIADYLTENWLIEKELIHQTEGEAVSFDFYNMNLSQEQKKEIFGYLEQKYAPVKFNEPVPTISGGYVDSSYPVFRIQNYYWKEESGWYDIRVRCDLYSSTATRFFKLSYVFHNGEWNFLGESAILYEDLDWYDKHEQEAL